MNQLFLRLDNNRQWQYKIRRPDNSVVVDWQYGTYDRAGCVEQAIGRFGPCEESIRTQTKLRLYCDGTHSRNLLATGLKDQIVEMNILVNYQGDGSADKGIPLDNEIIPRITDCVNACANIPTPGATIPKMLQSIRNLTIVANTFKGESTAIQGMIDQANALLKEVGEEIY